MTVIKEQAYAGYPSRLPGVCFVHPVLVGEMLKMGSNVYSSRLGMLLLTPNEIRKIMEEKGAEVNENTDLSPLPFLLKSAQANDSFYLELQAAFATFIKEEITLLPKINSVLIGPMAEKRLINEKNFTDFQTILNLQNRKKVPEPPENESPYARKMRLAAERRDAVKRKQQQKQGGTQDLADLMEIAEVFGIDYKNKSIYAFYGLIQRHQLREKWTQDIQMLCAGADSKKIKAKYWGANPDD